MRGREVGKVIFEGAFTLGKKFNVGFVELMTEVKSSW